MVTSEFSPPYGDGTDRDAEIQSYLEFSPPYGDGTFMLKDWTKELRFSPPYGDGTLNISQKIVKWKS